MKRRRNNDLSESGWETHISIAFLYFAKNSLYHFLCSAYLIQYQHWLYVIVVRRTVTLEALMVVGGYEFGTLVVPRIDALPHPLPTFSSRRKVKMLFHPAVK